MKIVFVVDRMGGGGIERLLVDMVRQLKEAGHEPVAIPMASSGPLLADLEATGVRVRSITDNIKDIGFFKPAMIKRLRQVIREEAPDIVHLCDIVSGHVGRIACLGLGIPVIYALHSMAPHGKRKYRVASSLLSFVTDHYVAVSREVWEATGSHQNIAGKPYTVIHNGVNQQLFFESKPIDIAQDIIGSDGPVVMSCGRLVPLKNVDLLIRSFVSVLEKIPNASLLILGDGPERERLEALAREMEVDGSTFFLGFRDDVPSILKGLASMRALMAMPSEYEGFSVAFAEALYCGLPVVISEQAAPKDIVGAGVVHCSLDETSLSSALCKALDNADMYAEMSHSARNLGANLTIANTIDEHLRVYECVLSQKKGTGIR